MLTLRQDNFIHEVKHKILIMTHKIKKNLNLSIGITHYSNIIYIFLL